MLVAMFMWRLCMNNISCHCWVSNHCLLTLIHRIPLLVSWSYILYLSSVNWWQQLYSSNSGTAAYSVACWKRSHTYLDNAKALCLVSGQISPNTGAAGISLRHGWPALWYVKQCTWEGLNLLFTLYIHLTWHAPWKECWASPRGKSCGWQPHSMP
jgi:hypothetical protein